MSNHERFLSHLDASIDAVWQIARFLSSRGYNIEVPAASRASKHEDWRNHADCGDIYISQRVEVKKLGVSFASRIDWPFEDKFIVCAKHSYDMAIPKPYAYIIVSQDGSHAATVFSSDADKWYVERRKDSRYENVEQEFYFAQLDTVKFFPLGIQEQP
jgi:hypothetical protein